MEMRSQEKCAHKHIRSKKNTVTFEVKYFVCKRNKIV